MLGPNATYKVKCPHCGVRFETTRLYCYTRSDEFNLELNTEVPLERSQDDLSSFWEMIKEGGEAETEDGYFTVLDSVDTELEQTLWFKLTLSYAICTEDKYHNIYYTRRRESPDAAWGLWAQKEL
jgi:hypothetical protein